MVRRTLRGWFEYLDDPKREISLFEFAALMLFNIREYSRITMEQTKQAREASEHTESIVGAMDELLARWTEAQGIPYAASGTVRSALFENRRKQLEEPG